MHTTTIKNATKTSATKTRTLMLACALPALLAFTACEGEPDADAYVEQRTSAVTAASGQPISSGATASANAAAWTTLQGPTAGAAGPPQMTIKMNDNLQAFTEVLVPALADANGLNGKTMAKLPLLRDVTRANLGILGDIFFSCHDEDTPIVFDIRDLHLDMGIDDDATSAVFDGSPILGSKIRFDANLPGFEVEGTLYFHWPASEGSWWCRTFGTTHHFEIPFTIRGASLESSVSMWARNGTLELQSFSLNKLSIDDVTIQPGALDVLTDIGIAITDTVASAFQDLKDGLTQVDLQPENGICNSPGTTPNLESCLASVVTAYVAGDLAGAGSSFQKMIHDALVAPLPAALPVPVGTTSFSVAPEIVDYTEHDDNDNATIKATLVPTSTAPTAACATAVRPAAPRGAAGSFSPQKDVDMVIPFDMIEAALYEVTRQGLFCIPSTPIGVGTAKIDSSGPVTLSNMSALIANIAQAGTTAGVGGATTAGVAGATATSSPIGGAGAGASTAPAPTPELFTTHPMKLTFTGWAAGSISLTAQLGWDVVFTCNNQIVLQLASATRVALSGQVSLTGGGVVSATDPAVRSQIDAQLAALPGRIPALPIGPSVIGLPGGVYLQMAAPNLSERELQIGLTIRNTIPAACAPSGGGGSTPGSYGDDTDDGSDWDVGLIPGTTGTVGGTNPGGTGTGTTSGPATTAGAGTTGGSTSTRP